jgi:hypothetical protein
MRNLGILAVLLAFSLSSWSYETDQYTVPQEPLADIGEDLSRFIYNQIDQEIAQINSDFITLPQKIENLKLEMNQMLNASVQNRPGAIPDEIKSAYQFDKEELELAVRRWNLMQSTQGVTELLHNSFGGKITWQEQRDAVFGLPLTIWPYKDNRKDGKLVSFHQPKTGTIYSFSGFNRIISPTYFVFASTMLVYGHYVGVDKFGHLLNQGFQYLQLYQEGLKNSLTPDQAVRKAVDWGAGTEDGIFGMLVDGVYSNGDLAGNYAGFKLFMNFLKPVQIGTATIPAQIIRENDGRVHWASDARKPEEFLRPFITDHLDESLNASVIERAQRGIVRHAIRSRCQAWSEFRGFKNREQVKTATSALSTWFGEDYGHRADGTIQIDETCWPAN